MPHGLRCMVPPSPPPLPERPGLHSSGVELTRRRGVTGAESTCGCVSALRGQPDSGVPPGPCSLEQDRHTDMLLTSGTRRPPQTEELFPSHTSGSVPCLERQWRCRGCRSGRRAKKKMPLPANPYPERWGQGGGGWVQEPHYQLLVVGDAGGVLGEAAVEIHYEKAGVGAGISWGRRAVPGAWPSSLGLGLGAAPRDRSIPHSHLTHSPPLYT